MGTTNLFAGILCFLLFAIAGRFLLALTVNHKETFALQSRLFLIAIAIRFAGSLVLYEGGLVKTIKDEDGSGWVVGEAYRQNWEIQGYTFIDTPSLFLDSYHEHHKGYYYLLACFFMFTDLTGRLPAAALNCLMGGLTVVLVYRLARSLFSERVAELAGWLACFFPSLIVWSSQTLKEPVVIFLETLALYGCIQLNRHGSTVRHVLLVGFACVLIFPFRFYASYLVAATVCLTLLIPRTGGGEARLRSLLAVGGIIAAFVAFSGGIFEKEASLEKYDLKYLQHFREGSQINDEFGQGANSSVKMDYDLQTPTGLGLSLLVGALHLLLAPFPWQWVTGSLRILLVVPEVVLWWVLLVYGVIPGLRHSIRNRLFDVYPLLIFIFGMGLLYSLMFTNVGLVYRQRAELLPWLLIFAAVGIELRRIKRTQLLDDEEQVPAANGVPEPGVTVSLPGN